MRVSSVYAARKADFRSRMPQSSYYQNSQPGAALQRARRQYLGKNTLTGTIIFGFAIGVFAFTLQAVAQDEFEDVPIPDGPAPSPAAPHSSMNKSAGATTVGT